MTYVIVAVEIKIKVNLLYLITFCMCTKFTCNVCDMSYARGSKDFDIKKCIVSAKKPEPAPRCTKEICNLKLKNAEKTIANKDVIIKMLQDQVKKLEDTYKQNLKATENFRYKFHVATEQIKRLRSNKKIDDSDSNEQRSKEPKRKVSSKPSQDKCCTAQQIENIENFIKSHYELLQNLVEKFSEKQNFQTDSESNKICMEQLALLQKEIDQLKEENLKLNDQLELQKDPLIPKITDSILDTYRRTNEQLQKKFSQMIELGSTAFLQEEEEEDLCEDSDRAGKRISFSKKRAEDSESPRSSLKVIKEEEKSLQNEYDGYETPKPVISISEPELSPERHVSMHTPVAEVIELNVDDEEANTKDDPVKTRQEEKIISKESVTDYKSCQSEIGNKRQSDVSTEAKPEAVGDSLEKETKPTNKLASSDKACQCEEETPKEPSVLEETKPKEDEVDPDKKEVSSIVAEIGRNPYDKAICFCTGVSCTYINPSTDTEVEENLEEKTSTILVDRSMSKASDTSKPKISFAGSEDESAPKMSIDEMSEQPTNVATIKDLNDITEKLNDIRDKVTELLNKQIDTQSEIELLKNDLAVSRDTTKECTENIAKLKETIDEQKQTFLANFQEHKTIIDNLTQINDKIQSELADLKNKIDILFKSLEEVQNEHKQKHAGGNSGSVITVNELHIKNKADGKNRDLKNGHSTTTVGEPSIQILETDVPNKEVPKNLDKHPQQQCEVLEDNKLTLEKMQCINDLISYYKKVSTEVLTLSKPHSVKHSDSCTCKDQDIFEYIDKVKSENSKLKSTISSVISHLHEKMSELKDVQNQKKDDPKYCICQKNAEEIRKVDLEIEDIFNAVRNTCQAKKLLHESSTSCICGNKPVIVSSSHTCGCNSDLPSSGNSNVEDIYASVLCMCKCGVYPSQTIETSVTCNEGKSCDVPEENVAVVGECCSSDDCIVSNVENYVNYLYEQLNIISCIENRIEDMRCHIKTPENV